MVIPFGALLEFEGLGLGFTVSREFAESVACYAFLECEKMLFEKRMMHDFIL